MTEIFYPASFVYGLITGSFLNVCILRIPAGKGIAGRSRCPECGRRIRLRDQVPLLSWLALRGRCRDCGGRISLQYPLVELLTGIIFLAVAARFGFSAETAKYWLFSSIMIVVAVIDLRTMLIPNRLVLAGVATSILFLGRDNWHEALIGGVACFITMLLLYLASRGGLGEGDVKLALVIGLYLGWPMSVVALALSALLGGAVGVILLASGLKKRKDPVPFGPALAAGAVFTGVYGWSLAGWYLSGGGSG